MLVRQALVAAILLGVVAPASAQLQDAGQQKCLLATSSAASKLAKTSAKEFARCLKSAASGTLAGCSAEDCVASDAGGKVDDALTKLREAAADSCRVAPDFGHRHPSFVGSVVVRETIGLLDDVLGPDLDAATVPKSEDARAAACQGKAVKAVTKLGLSMSALYDACRKAAVKTATSADDLAGCLAAIDADAQGKVDSALQSLAGAVAGTCEGVDLATVFAGSCAAAPDLAACVEERARCRACRRARGSDGLDVDCEIFDNGAADGTCSGQTGRCNGRAALCERAFDAVAYATTHNAYSNAEESWTAPNQRYGLTRQLSEGVRSMMLDTYEFEGGLYFCHGSCTIGTGDNIGRSSMVQGLVELRQYLEAHAGAVLSIIFESYISEAQTQQAFTDAGLMPYLHAQPVGQPWPSLQQLVDAGTRLIVFTDDSAASAPWHHYVWDFAWETPYSFQSADDFVCSINRGDYDNSLYILNHFLTDPVGSPQLANKVNKNPLFIDRALQCQSESGRLPNFVTVDFYDIGHVFDVVGALNGFGRCTP
ncbi:MAG TPA: hypothetical protein VEC57_16620 [Candidatus Limnocylindrales bacterium]|nr:hypothetical protein [Candidatus Limnocylindrales bacterium]